MHILNEESDNYNENILLDIQAFKNMTYHERHIVRDKLIEKYGEDLGKSYAWALYHGSNFSDSNMQKAIFENLSLLSEIDGLLFMSDLQLATRKYLSGQELKASFIITLDINNHVDYGSDEIDVFAYFNSISEEEFEYIIFTLKNSHEELIQSLEKEQNLIYLKTYAGILNIYNMYKNIPENSKEKESTFKISFENTLKKFFS